MKNWINDGKNWGYDLDKKMLLYNGSIKASDINFKCLHPKILPLHKNKKIKWKTIGIFKKIYPLTNLYQRAILVACGKCEFCRQQQSYKWGQRIADEAHYQKLYNNRENLFITLTYNDNNAISPLFEYNNLYKKIVKNHMDTFIKKFRNHFRFYDKNGKRQFDKNINYFWVSELGSKTLRRHQHLIITGVPKWFTEKNNIFISMSKSNEPLYTNEWLLKNWNMGFINYGNVSDASAMYVAQYCFKKNGYENVYKCSSQNLGKSWYYYGQKYQPHCSNYDYPSKFHLKLKKKDLTNEQYINLLKWIESENKLTWNFKNQYQTNTITVKNYRDNHNQNNISISGHLTTLKNKAQANRNFKLMFGSKTRDFDTNPLDSLDLQLMRLRQRKNRRF